MTPSIVRQPPAKRIDRTAGCVGRLPLILMAFGLGLAAIRMYRCWNLGDGFETSNPAICIRGLGTPRISQDRHLFWSWIWSPSVFRDAGVYEVLPVGNLLLFVSGRLLIRKVSPPGVLFRR